MIYRVIGLMSGSSLDGLDIAFVQLEAAGSQWSYEIKAATCYPYDDVWVQRLQGATQLPANAYMQLHCDYGALTGQLVNRFIEEHQLQYQVQLIASHGHTTFHSPATKMTHQLGDGAAIAATTGINVVSDLRQMDVALGGEGAPIVPIGEKYLLGNHQFFLNLGGIANVSVNTTPYQAFDICAANRVLNLLAGDAGLQFDHGGQLARSGQVHHPLLQQLNQLSYYQQAPPKSLANSFGTDIVLPLIRAAQLPLQDALCTYTEHIAVQVAQAVQAAPVVTAQPSLLATGGGAFNHYLVERIRALLPNLIVVVPDDNLVNFKEALMMAFIGVLRWREENNVMCSVTGAARDSIGGAVWSGQAW